VLTARGIPLEDRAPAHAHLDASLDAALPELLSAVTQDALE
jgi:hypothetical protein